MKAAVEKTIDMVYRNKNYNYFVEKCKTSFTLPIKILDFVQSLNCELIELKENNQASKKWWVKYKRFHDGNFEVSYTTILSISKIGSFFNVEHEFSVINPDGNRMCPTLDGFDGEPFTMQQFSMNEVISKELTNAGYIELSYAELNEVICDVTKSCNESIYGIQPTVENLLFHDFLDIYEKITHS